MLGGGAGTISTTTARADGIPEPGILYYGAITNTANSNKLLTNSANQLIWSVQEAGGSAIAIITPVQNLMNGAGQQFSYRFRVPFESVVGGNTASTNAFALRPGSTAYNNASVRLAVGTHLLAAHIVGIGNLSATHSAAIRGQAVNVNLTVNALTATAFASGGGGGGSFGARTNLLTAVGGQSTAFQFIAVIPHPDGGYFLEWIGAPTNRNYILIRSQDVSGSTAQQEVVQQFSPSTTVVNTFWDTNVVNTTTYFYRLIAP